MHDWRPYLLDASRDPDALASLRAKAAFVHDEIDAQLRDLVDARAPQRELGGAELEDAVEELLGGRPRDGYGRWAYLMVLDRDSFRAQLRDDPRASERMLELLAERAATALER